MKEWRRMCHAQTIFFTLVLLVVMVYLFYTVFHGQGKTHSTPQQDTDYRRDVANKLVDIVREMADLDCKVDSSIPLRLNAIIGQLDSRFLISDGEMLRNETETDVCSDTFISTTTGYPFYQQNDPPPTNCSGDVKRPVSELITILVNNVNNPSERLQLLLSDIRGYNQHIPVIVADLHAPFLGVDFGNVHFISVNQKKATSSPGAVWNALIHQVTTPYVLLGRHLEYFSAFARLERQMYAISVSHLVAVAGGAFRNTTGHWRVGCYQSEMKNYHLRYMEGYRYSAYSCMFCDHLDGPFVARSSLLRDMPLDENLPDMVVFEDWFLSLKRSGHLVVNCPDSMYLVHTSNLAQLPNRDPWLPLANKWQICCISVPADVTFVFSCKEVGLSCNPSKWVNRYLLPPCCLQQMTNAWRTLEYFLSQYNIPYELDSGSMLGAVKMQNQMPWDLDMDVLFHTLHYNTFLNNQTFFLSKGLKVEGFDPRNYGFFRIWTPDIRIDMSGWASLTTTYLPASLQDTPTRVNVLGFWLCGATNPGLYARNRYGFDYLRHAQHWSILRIGIYDSYSTHLGWKPCPKPYHHACLDHFPVDGSVDFVP